MTNITIKITDAQELTLQFLHKLGMSQDESLLIMRNLIAAELTGKSTHGLIRLMAFQKKSLQNKLNKSDTPLVILNVTPTSLLRLMEKHGVMRH
jgi:LDH2 family malate/lactate/ureidoglycolate dehydrogenase